MSGEDFGGRLARDDIIRGEKKKDLVYGNKTSESQSAQRTTIPGDFSISIGIEKKDDESLFNFIAARSPHRSRWGGARANIFAYDNFI